MELSRSTSRSPGSWRVPGSPGSVLGFRTAPALSALSRSRSLAYLLAVVGEQVPPHHDTRHVRDRRRLDRATPVRFLLSSGQTGIGRACGQVKSVTNHGSRPQGARRRCRSPEFDPGHIVTPNSSGSSDSGELRDNAEQAPHPFRATRVARVSTHGCAGNTVPGGIAYARDGARRARWFAKPGGQPGSHPWCSPGRTQDRGPGVERNAGCEE